MPIFSNDLGLIGTNHQCRKCGFCSTEITSGVCTHCDPKPEEAASAPIVGENYQTSYDQIVLVTSVNKQSVCFRDNEYPEDPYIYTYSLDRWNSISPKPPNREKRTRPAAKEEAAGMEEAVTCRKCHLPLSADHTHRTYEEHDACRNADPFEAWFANAKMTGHRTEYEIARFSWNAALASKPIEEAAGEVRLPELPEYKQFGEVVAPPNWWVITQRERQLLAQIKHSAALEGELRQVKEENSELKRHAPRWIKLAKDTTHFEGCWQDHRACALAKIDELEAELRRREGETPEQAWKRGFTVGRNGAALHANESTARDIRRMKCPLYVATRMNEEEKP
jgi:hypothetical protein